MFNRLLSYSRPRVGELSDVITGIGVALSIIDARQGFTFGRNQARLVSCVFDLERSSASRSAWLKAPALS